MKKIFSTAAVLAGSVVPFLAVAQAVTGRAIAPTPYKTLDEVNTNFICVIVDWMFTFLIFLVILFVIVAAYKYLTSAGDPEKVKSANYTIIYAVVALAVAIIAKGVPFIVASFFPNSSGFAGCP